MKNLIKEYNILKTECYKFKTLFYINNVDRLYSDLFDRFFENLTKSGEIVNNKIVDKSNLLNKYSEEFVIDLEEYLSIKGNPYFRIALENPNRNIIFKNAGDEDRSNWLLLSAKIEKIRMINDDTSRLSLY